MNEPARLRIFQVEAFTMAAPGGNPANVVLDADALDEAAMASLSREFGERDTAFVLRATAPDHDLRVRFYTPRAETAFIGHATIAVAAARDSLGLPAAPRQLQRGGLAWIERLSAEAGGGYAFTRPPPPLQQAITEPLLARILAALGVAPEELDASCPPLAAGEGGSRALIALRDGSALARLRPDMAALEAMSAAGAPPGYFVYTLSPAVPGCDTEARMFCPAIGIPEDPVSGNAHALLAMRLLALRRIAERDGEPEFTSCQGHHMGRPGRLTVRIRREGAAVRGVRIAGRARLVGATHIERAAGPD